MDLIECTHNSRRHKWSHAKSFTNASRNKTVPSCKAFQIALIKCMARAFNSGRARNVTAYKGQGLPGSGAFDFDVRLRDMACPSSRRKGVGRQHPPHSTRKVKRICAIRGTVVSPLP